MFIPLGLAQTVMSGKAYMLKHTIYTTDHIHKAAQEKN